MLDLFYFRQRGESPLLSLAEIRAANCGLGSGLNMMTVHNGSLAFFGVGSLATVMNKMVEWAAFSTSGYRLQEYFIEVYGPNEWTWCEGMGLSLRRDFAMNGAVPSEIPLDKSPRLYSITLSEARHRFGTAAAVMFQWQPPCFFFSSTEQEMLLYALAGDTDEELAGHLNVATITIKKRWEGIYKRVEAAQPEVFEAAGAVGKRGGEKKRRLLAYLRHHLEELRPLPPNN